MSRMGEELEKRLDENKYDMWVALDQLYKECEAVNVPSLHAMEQAYNVLSKIKEESDETGTNS